MPEPNDEGKERELTDPAKRLEELANEGGVTFTPAELRYLATAFQHETEALEAYRKERDWLEDKLRPSDDRVRELEKAAYEADKHLSAAEAHMRATQQLPPANAGMHIDLARALLSTKTEAAK